MFKGFVSQLFFNLLRGVQRFPSAALFRQERAYGLFLLRRDPALEIQHRFIRQDTLGALLLGCLGPEPVGVDPKGVPVFRTGRDGGSGVILRLFVCLQIPFQRTDILRRRPGHSLESHRAEAEGPQQLLCFLLIAAVDDHKQILL